MPDGNSKEPPSSRILKIYALEELRERSRRIAVADEAVSNFEYLMSEYFDPERPGYLATSDQIREYNRLNSIIGFRVCLSVWLNSAQLESVFEDNLFAIQFESEKGVITRTEIGEGVISNLRKSVTDKAKRKIMRRCDRVVDAAIFFDLIQETEDARSNLKPLRGTQRLNEFMDAVTHFECDFEHNIFADPTCADGDAARDKKEHNRDQ